MQYPQSFTVGGVTYSSPGVAVGGRGGHNTLSANGGNQGSGFGGGGAGGSTINSKGGNGGAGGSSPGSGGAARSLTNNTGNSWLPGFDGGVSAGGGGSIAVFGGSGTSGAGGNAYGSNGSAGHSDRDSDGGGGGGAGGSAGRSGVHVVLSAPVIRINGSLIITGGTAGQKGGNGGSSPGPANPGSGGGGGGGGNGGNIYLYANSVERSTASLSMYAGTGGAVGTGYQNGIAGTAGTPGSLIEQVVEGPSLIHSETYLSNIVLSEDSTLSLSGIRSSASSSSPSISEGPPKIPVNVNGFGGGYGAALGYAVDSYGVILRPVLDNYKLEVDDLFSETFISGTSLIQAHVLSVQGIRSSTAISSITLKQEHLLQVDGMKSTWQMDNIDLIESLLLSVQGTESQTRVQSLELIQNHILAVNDIKSNTSSEQIALKQSHLLSVASLGTQTYIDGDIVLDQYILLNKPDDLRSGTKLDSISLSQNNVLSIDSIRTSTFISEIPKIINWSDMGWDFGRYRNGYGQSGNLDEFERFYGTIRGAYTGGGELQNTDIDEYGRYKEQYKQNGIL